MAAESDMQRAHHSAGYCVGVCVRRNRDKYNVLQISTSTVGNAYASNARNLGHTWCRTFGTRTVEQKKHRLRLHVRRTKSIRSSTTRVA